MKEKQGKKVNTEKAVRQQAKKTGFSVAPSGNHIKVAELLENAITPEPRDSKNSKWFVEINVVDKITGLVSPVKVLL